MLLPGNPLNDEAKQGHQKEERSGGWIRTTDLSLMRAARTTELLYTAGCRYSLPADRQRRAGTATVRYYQVTLPLNGP